MTQLRGKAYDAFGGKAAFSCGVLLLLYSVLLTAGVDAVRGMADNPEHASLLGGIADGIVLVVRLGITPRHQVEQTHNTLEALGGNVLGTCLTGAEEENSYD